MKILLVEDEPKTAAYLRKGLTESGFVVDTAAEGEQGLDLAAANRYDLILLDIKLPIRDGWSVLSEYLSGGGQAPILILTARDSVSDRVKGLELGADDYLIKPFAFSELVARIRTLLRRARVPLENVIWVTDLEVDLVRHVASRAGKRLELTPKEFLLLSLLARRRGEVLTRAVIAEQVWDMNFEPESNVVDVHIRRLRRRVDDAFDRKLIHTVRGFGYVLEDQS